MKKHLLIGTTVLALALSATSIYAQVVSGTSIVDKMKAVAHSFTLSTELNAGQTGLTSEPVKGKKTGDILTAGEWNRMLEIVSQGSTGSSGGSGWVDVPLTDTNPFDHNGCQYRVKLTGPAYNAAAGFSADGYFSSDYVTGGIVQLDSGIFIKSGTKNIVYVMDQANGAIVEVTTAWGWRPTKIEKLCGAAGGVPATVTGSGAQIVEGGVIKTSTKTISNWDLITLEGSWNGGSDAAPSGGYIYKIGGQARLSYVEASGISKDLVLTTTAQNVHNLTVKLSGDSVIIDPSTTNTLAYVVWKFSGGTGGSSSGLVDVPLTDTADFDPNCDYRVTMNYVGGTGNSVWMGASSGSHLAAGVSTKYLSFVNAGTAIFGIRSTNKNQYGSKDTSGNYTVSSAVQITKLQKRCQ